jgi:prepilin-type N-terminal cleavage/methylation domain-containing protein
MHCAFALFCTLHYALLCTFRFALYKNKCNQLGHRDVIAPGQNRENIMRTTRRNRRNQAGFNLIELMIVIAIIALLVAVGIPGWQAMVRSGNEATAVQTIQTIRTCQNAYSGKNKGRFAPFATLVQNGCLDGGQFNSEAPVINGYVFTLRVEEPSGTRPSFFSLNVDPQVTDGIQRTGDRHFYFDSSLGAVKFTEENRPAKADDQSM